MHRDEQELASEWSFELCAEYPCIVIETDSRIDKARGTLDGEVFTKLGRRPTLTLLGRGSELSGSAGGSGNHKVLVLTLTPQAGESFPEFPVIDIRASANLEDREVLSVSARLSKALALRERLLVESLCCEVTARVLRFHGYCTRAHVEKRVPLSPRQMRAAMELIEESHPESVGVAALAGACNLSKTYFLAAFKQSFGVTPHQFVLRKRLQRAKRLLANAAMPLALVGHAAGFCHQSHFCSSFKAAFGMTPLAYRRAVLPGRTRFCAFVPVG